MFDAKDEAMHKALMKLLDDATFPLQAKEIAAFAQVYSWAKELPVSVKAKHEMHLKQMKVDADVQKNKKKIRKRKAEQKKVEPK